MTLGSLAATGTLLVVAAACGGESQPQPPSCEAALRALEERIGKATSQQLGTAVGACISERWTAEVRTCVSQAATRAKYQSCITGREVDPPASTTAGPPVSTARRNIEVMLNRLGKSSKAYYVEHSAYPVGKVGPIPATSCCRHAGLHCPVTVDDWIGPFAALEFVMEEPHQYQFFYESAADGQSFTVNAYRNNCLGTEERTELRGHTITGQPAYQVGETAMVGQ